MSNDPTKRASLYEEAGVSLVAAEESVNRYKAHVKDTHIPGVMGSIGGFGGLFSLVDAGVSLKDPILVSATDGVGTKLKLAFELGVHDSIGVDCVAMCVNDVLATGARPLFFLDYIATGKLEPQVVEDVVIGIAEGCKQSGCALIGGETAEMPGFYKSGEYDVAGFCVGVVDREEILGPERVREGQAVIGLASTGFHSNGYSLVRRIIEQAELALSVPFGDSTLGAALLAPTRIYAGAIRAASGIKAVAHITGGGFFENIPRVLPEGLGVLITEKWPVPPIIEFIIEKGGVSREEAFHVFNMGVGMVLIVEADAAENAIQDLNNAGYPAFQIGHVKSGSGVEFL